MADNMEIPGCRFTRVQEQNFIVTGGGWGGSGVSYDPSDRRQAENQRNFLDSLARILESKGL